MNSSFRDNREYNYTDYQSEEREDYKYVVSLVKEGSSIIDLGCGNGSLMQKLIREKNVTAAGIELSKSGVEVCQQKGLNVIEGRIDISLPFRENEFDYAICHITIQMVTFPEILLSEMKRIAKYLIISFPNFAFYKNRIDLLFKGRMPKPMLFGYKWYNTGHIHQLSLKDLDELLYDIGGLKVIKKEQRNFSNPVKNYIAKKFPNLFHVLTVILLKKL